MWLDGMVSVGNHLNYITEHSFLVYDTYDPIMFISSGNLSYYFKKNDNFRYLLMDTKRGLGIYKLLHKFIKV